jgi:transposase InsO family protein
VDVGSERPESFRFLIRDRDQKFTDSFDEVFRSNGLEIVRTPFRAPQANGVAERFVRTACSECLDWLLILNDQHLERVLDIFVEHLSTSLVRMRWSHSRRRARLIINAEAGRRQRPVAWRLQIRARRRSSAP